ncbi:hypothetical protein WIS52_30585 [Pseudonocardia nematodicida]|uniref:Uncharacterized protein n=1 Tax=Pseudonocardia nematodicida TaxID=1206997 RepID=A0ABV1KK44_9PSEU
MALLVLEWIVAAVLLAAGVMLLVVGAFVTGGIATLIAAAWLVRCIRRT